LLNNVVKLLQFFIFQLKSDDYKYIFVYMQTIRVKTAQNIDIDYEVAGIGERTLARLIDLGFFVVLYILALIAFVLVQKTMGRYMALIVIVIVYATLFVFYDLLCETLMNGQSFGKRIMKIKVISIDGGRPSFSQYLLRWLFRIVDFSLTFQLGALLTAALTEKQQRIGDVVAGTTLIKITARTNIKGLVFTPPGDGYQPIFTDLSLLSDKDIVLIKEVISAYVKSGNMSVVTTAATHIKTLLNVTQPDGMNDLKFLQTVIKDYNHLAVQVDEA
jgi:uncharacterized RDD family membrane protein YckC